MSHKDTSRYIRERSKYIQVEIVRNGISIKKQFPYRQYANKKEALAAAQAYRDSAHLEHFGESLKKTFHHLQKRAGSSNNDLPPRISIQKVNGKDYYYVVSFLDHNGKQIKKRFPINKLGRKESLIQAIEFEISTRT